MLVAIRTHVAAGCMLSARVVVSYCGPVCMGCLNKRKYFDDADRSCCLDGSRRLRSPGASVGEHLHRPS